MSQCKAKKCDGIFCAHIFKTPLKTAPKVVSADNDADKGGVNHLDPLTLENSTYSASNTELTPTPKGVGS